jgi:hypothetical protein
MAIQNRLSPVVGESPTGRENRQGRRFRVLLNAELITTTDEQAVRVRDISTGGAMLEGRHPIAKAKDVILRRGNIEIFAQVCWTEGNQCGVEFDEALTEADMMAFVHEPARRASFVPEPFRSSIDLDEEGIATGDWAAVQAFRNPIGRGVFGQ